MKFLLSLFAVTVAVAEITTPVRAADAEGPMNSGNPFGIASGAEWSGDYPRFEPMLSEAGVGWLRYFPEWHSLQPKPGEWEWQRADDFVAKSRENHIQLTAPLAYFAPWASSGNDTRTFPVKDMEYWKEFVAGVVGRYHQDIQCWEMWNEPQSFQKNGTPQLYADMVRAAYDAGKKVDPRARFGLTSANYAVAYLNMVLKAGATDHFDYLCVHPYENMEQLNRPGGEVYFLSMADNLRRLLTTHRQRADIPLWITEIGWQATIEAQAEKDAQQAQLMVKAYVLSLAQGFDKVFWFEARGPAYGKGTDHGVIRKDWTPRPALTALKTMTTALGNAPHYAGWLDWNGSYAFLFESGGRNAVVAWSPVGSEGKVKLDGPATTIDLTGRETAIAAGAGVALTNLPVFVTGVPARIVAAAKSNRGKPFPWGGDYTASPQVNCHWGAEFVSQGMEPVSQTIPEKAGSEMFSRVKKGGGLSLRANPGFAPFGTTNLEIKIVARRADGAQNAGFQLMYETLKTIPGYDRAGYWTIPAGDGWQEHTWRVSDANFVGTWGYNLSMTEVSGDFLVKEVSVKKLASP